MSSAMTKITLPNANAVLTQRGLEPGGAVQKYVDRAVLDLSEPYIPKKTGALIASGKALGGAVCWDTPYARRQYYENRGQSGGQRGRLWFARMKASHLETILRGAASICGGKVR